MTGQHDTEGLGAYLKRIRETRSISIEEVSQATRIPVRMLVELESDSSNQLPNDVFVKGYLKSYAAVLNLDPADLVTRFLDGRKPSSPPPVPIKLLGNSGQRRSLGILVAAILLLVFGALALSFAMRPRRHDNAMDISWRMDSLTRLRRATMSRSPDLLT